MAISEFCRKGTNAGTATSLAITYAKVSDSSAYTPVSGDVLLIFATAAKASSGASTLTVPTGWNQRGTATQDNGAVNNTVFALTRVADGTSTDSPTVTVSSANWDWCSFVLQGASTTTVPSSPASLPETGHGSVSNGANTGFALTTVAANELVLSMLGMRGPAGITSIVWAGGSATDLAQIGSSNGFLCTASQTVVSPGAVTPSATWTGGSGTATNIMSFGFAPTVAAVTPAWDSIQI